MTRAIQLAFLPLAVLVTAVYAVLVALADLRAWARGW